MRRFTLDQKLNAVYKYLEGQNSYQDIATELQTDKKTIRKWVAFYNYHGIKGLQPRSSCQKYSNMFKLEVLQYIKRTGASYFDAAVKYNVPSPYTISRWKRAMVTNRETASVTVPKERPAMKPKKNHSKNDKQVKELEKEIDYLRMENAYLKKLQALVHQKQQSQQKKKHK